MGSSQTRARTHVPCIGRQILNHCATREAHKLIFLKCIYLEQLVKQLIYRSHCDWVLKPKETSDFRNLVKSSSEDKNYRYKNLNRSDRNKCAVSNSIERNTMFKTKMVGLPWWCSG